ncbi:MAG: hypothetical protein V7K92_18985 [Nostoc sp.]
MGEVSANEFDTGDVLCLVAMAKTTLTKEDAKSGGRTDAAL